MNIIFLALLLIIPAVSSGQYHADNCENWTATSIAPWNGRTQATGNSVSTTTALAFSGQFSLKSDDASTTANTAYMSRSWGGADWNKDFYVRQYVYFPTTYFSTFTAGQYGEFSLVLLTTGTPARYPTQMGVLAGNDAAGAKRLLMRVRSANGTSENITGPQVNEDQWYCVEYYCPDSSGTLARWWVDGVEQSTGTVNRWPPNATSVFCGFSNSGGIGHPSTYKSICYMDSMMIAEAYIGPEREMRRRYPKIFGY